VRFFKYAIVIICLLTAIPSHATQAVSERELARHGEIVSASAITDFLKSHYYGRLLKIEFERDDGLYTYEVVWLGPDDQIAEFEFNARNGNLIHIKGINIKKLERADNENNAGGR